MSSTRIDSLEGLNQVMAEPIALALLTWPVAAALAYPGWTLPWGWLAAGAFWLLAFCGSAYRGQRGLGFGNVMLFTTALAGIWSAFHLHWWAWTAAPLLLIGLLGAQRLGLRKWQQREGNTAPR